jgi:hypothetical protein
MILVVIKAELFNEIILKAGLSGLFFKGYLFVLNLTSHFVTEFFTQTRIIDLR